VTLVSYRLDPDERVRHCSPKIVGRNVPTALSYRPDISL
jgi:hypothetical protein